MGAHEELDKRLMIHRIGDKRRNNKDIRREQKSRQTTFMKRHVDDTVQGSEEGWQEEYGQHKELAQRYNS